MINGRHHGDADDDADEKVAFEGLLLDFMAKELLADNGARPATCHAKYQQCRFRNPAHPLPRRHFIGAIHDQRHHVDRQKPHEQRMGGKKAADRSENQK